ncbi:MAG TPA: copper resistance protein CopC [Candidatus Limnocylindria bacterium]|nr:copper resistance protein CopC [Candidatus Limnocylindria bacterium]
MRRLILAGSAVALAIAGALSFPGIASAHANYVRSNPAADARLVKPPTEVRISFSEPPDAARSEIQVLDEHGTRWDLGPAAASGEPNGLKVALRPMGDGGYTVAWTTLSAVDGHDSKGSFAFVVGTGPLPSLPDIPDATPPPTPLEVAGRTVSYAGIALALGCALFGLIVHAAEGPVERRRERQLFAIGGGAIALGTAALVLAQGDRLPPRLELLLSLRLLAGLAVVAALAPGLADRTRRYAIAGAAIGAALTATLVSHATALGNVKDMALDLVHVLSISAWSGGVVSLLWIHLLPGQRSGPPLRATVWRFSLVALTSVGLLVTAGLLQAVDRLVLIQDLWETPYGIALLAKILLVTVILAVASLNLLRYGPRAERAGLIRGTIVEAALLAGVFVAAGVLTALAPPAQPSGAAFDRTHHVDAYRIELVVPTTIPGRNRFVLRVHQGLQPVTGAEKVALRFTMVEHDMGEAELVATERAPGEYVAIGSPTAMYGTWHVQAIVRLSGKDDLTTLFTVPISPAAGQGATAAALTTTSFSLVVFPDPTLPAAGAPIELSVIALANGQPATGRAVSGTVVAKDGQPAAGGGSFTAKEQGAGRYLIDIPALAAGTWTIRISIGGPGDTADYTFTVTP